MTFYQLYLKFRFILLKLISVIESMLSLILRQIQQFFLFFVFGGDGNEWTEGLLLSEGERLFYEKISEEQYKIMKSMSLEKYWGSIKRS